MVHIPTHQLGLATAFLFLAVVHATPQEPSFFSASSSSSYGYSDIDTAVTSFLSSFNNNASGSAGTAEEPPIEHQHNDEYTSFDEAGLGPPEDSDSSQPPIRGSPKGSRRRKRQASTASSRLRQLQECPQSQMQQRPQNDTDDRVIDPRLLVRDGARPPDGTRLPEYPYESANEHPYNAGDKTGIAGETITNQASEPPSPRRRTPKKTQGYGCDKMTKEGKRCEMRYDTRAQLNHHMKNHDPKTHVCSHDGCKSAFSVPDQLARHERTVHATKNRFTCEYCGTSANRSDVIAKHKKTKKHKDKMATVIIHGDPEAEQSTQP